MRPDLLTPDQRMDAHWGVIPESAVHDLLAFLATHYAVLAPETRDALCQYLARHGGARFRQDAFAELARRGIALDEL